MCIVDPHQGMCQVPQPPYVEPEKSSTPTQPTFGIFINNTVVRIHSPQQWMLNCVLSRVGWPPCWHQLCILEFNKQTGPFLIIYFQPHVFEIIQSSRSSRSSRSWSRKPLTKWPSDPLTIPTAQCALCSVYFSAQLNKLRPILKFKKYYHIEHIFVPACSSARKIHFFKF